MYQSHAQSNEDGQRFVLRTLCKKIPVILSIFRSNSVQAWPLRWSYTNTYIGAPAEFLQWEEINTKHKTAETFPAAQCTHNGFMSDFIWILILFYVPLNTSNTLKHIINLVLSTWKLIYRSCFWTLNIHLYSFMQITEVHGARRFSKNQQQGSTDHMRKWNPCWWGAGDLPIALSSHLSSLLH